MCSVSAQPAQRVVACWPQVAQTPLGAVCVAIVDVMLEEMVLWEIKFQYTSGAVKAFDSTCANGGCLHDAGPLWGEGFGEPITCSRA